MTNSSPNPNAGVNPWLNLEQARAWALEAGFAEAGLVALPHADEARDAARFEEWVRAGRAGTMQYLQRTGEDGRLARSRVGILFPWARSAVVCFAVYNSAQPRSTEPADEGAGWMARYAWSSRMDVAKEGARGARRPTDYHKVLKKRLRALEARIREAWIREARLEESGGFEARGFVDTGPVVERALATAAGLGWTGKNTCLIHPKLGSYGFLAVLLTSLEVCGEETFEGDAIAGEILEEQPSGAKQAEEKLGISGETGGKRFSVAKARVDSIGFNVRAEGRTLHRIGSSAAHKGQPLTVPDRCGTCRRCLEACPTGALIAPYQMDAARCISYLTIEHRGAIEPERMEGMGRQVFGCDICQDVCPWNRKAPVAADPELEARAELVNPALQWLAAMDEAEFEERFNGSPVRRAGFWGLRRNVAIAMGNSGLGRFAPWLEKWSETADEGLRAAARWALEKMRRGPAAIL